jgi:hypothetical protein
MQEITIFYSWQDTLPGNVTRTFIEEALHEAVKAISTDETIKIKPRVDKDTAGVPGMVDIFNTILNKLREAEIVICDISIINTGAPKTTPNPNVLIELGYALRGFGEERVNNIITVINTAFGTTKDLPFDIMGHRHITYDLPQFDSSSITDGQERARLEKERRVKKASEKQKLVKALEEAIRTILAAAKPPSQVAQVIAAVESAAPNQAVVTRKFMEGLAADLSALALNFKGGEGELDERLIGAIGQSKDLALDFARVVKTVAQMKTAGDAALEIYNGFKPILEGYAVLTENIGRVSYSDIYFDFFKFIGHELFVTFFSFLLQERRWELIAKLLNTPIFIKNSPPGSSPGAVSFVYVEQNIESLDMIRRRRLGVNYSPRALLLYERHSQGELAQLVPLQQFAEADFFLLLRAEVERAKTRKWGNEWIAGSVTYMRGLPRYLIEARYKDYALELLAPLGIKTIEELQNLLAQLLPRLGQRYFLNLRFEQAFGDFDPKSLGTK